MGLFDREDFDRQLGELPGVTFDDQWDAHVAKVGGKVFCLLSDAAPPRIVFKVTEESFDILTALDGAAQPAYFAKRKWVEITERAKLTDADLLAYVWRSHEAVAAGLTKKLRAELGLA
ncbi:hypothetical protein GCM10007913_36820 [Devosia yakushimensis]|uniref:MmcQ/YjbR family DNA-binding protein n=1 Tax=Devosia yakushimensis TaxID=470028 RepID=A0ABQ5UIV7_9HYPH|nr:MmcQ/YjbR family DNA-binding protein [Devosia yakushimensis]GLQ11750.1 hypothetical protein GCM10007913_36820 [Devosia yakushimensis]